MWSFARDREPALLKAHGFRAGPERSRMGAAGNRAKHAPLWAGGPYINLTHTSGAPYMTRSGMCGLHSAEGNPSLSPSDKSQIAPRPSLRDKVSLDQSTNRF